MKPETFKRLRQAMGLNQKELGGIMGIGWQYVSHLETGLNRGAFFVTSRRWFEP